MVNAVFRKVNSVLRKGILNYSFMDTTIYTSTISAGPLFDWFAKDKNNRAKLRTAGYSDGRITNWKSRGIPRGEVGNIAPLMGMTYEQYILTAELRERRLKRFQRAAVWAGFWLAVTLTGVFDNKSFAAISARQVTDYNTHSRAFRRWLSRILRGFTFAFPLSDAQIT